MKYLKSGLILLGLVLLLGSLFVGGRYAHLSVLGLALICLANAWSNWKEHRSLAVFSLAAAILAGAMVLFKL